MLHISQLHPEIIYLCPVSAGCYKRNVVVPHVMIDAHVLKRHTHVLKRHTFTSKLTRLRLEVLEKKII